MAEGASSSTPLVNREETSTGGFRVPLIPRVVAGPLEALFSAIGNLGKGALSLVASRGMNVTSRARPWLEFADLSALGPAQGGAKEYLRRFRVNVRWFMLNYIVIGLVMAAISVITKPLALLGAVLLIWVYFQLFGAAQEGQEEVRFLGLMLDDEEKAGLMLVLSIVVFWISTDGFEVIMSVVLGTLIIAIIHGSLRKPHQDALATPQRERQIPPAEEQPPAENQAEVQV